MRVCCLNTTNIRNLRENNLVFSEGTNILFGKNAQGKTNIIESLYIVGTLKSFRKADNNQIIQFTEKESQISSEILKNEIKKDIKITISRENNKKVYINGKKIYKYSDYLGNIIVTLFCPEDLMIIGGDASNRRKYLDLIFCQTDNAYLSDLINYNKIVKQRNTAIKDIKYNGKKESILEPWDEQLIKYGSKIIDKRHKNVLKLNEYTLKSHKKIKNNEILSIKYADTICGGIESSLADIELSFKNKQKRVRAEELAKGTTIAGPHRDDVVIEINEINARIFGSQGQKRSAAISLRMAEAEYIKEIEGEYPVLLLDDIFSELDNKRRDELVNILSMKAQIFITGTDINVFKTLADKAEIFEVEQGRVGKHNEFKS